MDDLGGSTTAALAPARPERARAGADPLVVHVAARRAEIEAVLRRHRVPAAEAPARVAEAFLAVAPIDATSSAAAGFAGRMRRALEIACVRRRRAAGTASGGEREQVQAAHRDGNGSPKPSGKGDPRPAPAAGEEPFGWRLVLLVVERQRRRLCRRIARERREAPALVAAALARQAVGPAGAAALAADPAAFATFGVVEHLLAAAASAWLDDARRARDLADLAVAAARRLDPAVYGAAALADLEAHALATLGNARRVAGDLAGAEAALAEAGRRLADGSRDARLRADLLRLQAVLRRAEGRRADSLRLLDQAAAVYRWLRDGHLVARTLLQRAKLHEDDDPARAAALAEEAMATIDLAREPRLELVALHNLVGYRHAAGDLDGAAALLPQVAAAAGRLGGRLDRLRLRWLAARIAGDRGDEAAAGELAAVRDAFLALEMPLDAILAALDLAALHLARGESAETRRLAEELAPLVATRAVDREVLAALVVFREAARLDRATAALARATAETLRRRQRPGAPLLRPS